MRSLWTRFSGLWPMLMRSTVYIAGFGYILLLARILGPAQFGRYSYVSSVVELVAAAISFGSIQLVMRESYTLRQIRIGPNAIVMGVLAVATLFLALLTGATMETALVIAMLAFANSFDIALMQGSIGVGRYKLVSLDFTLRYSIAAALIIGLFAAGQPMSATLALATQIPAAAVTIFCYFASNHDCTSWSPRGFGKIADRASFTGATLLTIMARRCEFLLLGLMGLNDANALLRIAILVGELPGAFAEAQMSSKLRCYFSTTSKKMVLLRQGRREYTRTLLFCAAMQLGLMAAAPLFALALFGNFRLVPTLLVTGLGMLLRLPYFLAEKALAVHAKPILTSQTYGALLVAKAASALLLLQLAPESFYWYFPLYALAECAVFEFALRKTFGCGILFYLARSSSQYWSSWSAGPSGHATRHLRDHALAPNDFSAATSAAAPSNGMKAMMAFWRAPKR